MPERFAELVRLMARLRALDGCPWDRKQTHDSLKPYLLEETYEVLETIDKQDAGQLREELGDLLLQILFHAQIATEAGTFTIDDVMQRLAEKLVHRHPHVFDKDKQEGGSLEPEEVVARWEEIKRKERKDNDQPASPLDGVPKTLPALLRAFQLQARASRVGFDWPHNREGVAQVQEKIEEEFRELREAWGAVAGEGRRRIESEFGDVLFAMVNLARTLKINPEEALRKATNRFADRFHHIEAAAARSGRTLETMSLAEMDSLWEEAKRKSA